MGTYGTSEEALSFLWGRDQEGGIRSPNQEEGIR
jgi:hypothetical protein